MSLLLEVAEAYADIQGTVLLVRRPDLSTYYFFSETQIPECLKALLGHSAKRSDRPEQPIEFVYGNRAKFDNFFG